MNISNKTELRKYFIQKRKNLSARELAVASAQICTHLSAWPVLQEAKTVMLFYPLKYEPNILPLFGELWARGIRLVIPASLNRTEHTMQAAYWHPDMELSLGSHGVMEPAFPKIAEPRDIDIIIVPGLAFDIYGGRLGFGAGYYDRFLLPLQEKSRPMVGVVLREFLLDGPLPLYDYDINMNFLCSEEGVAAVKKVNFA